MNPENPDPQEETEDSAPDLSLSESSLDVPGKKDMVTLLRKGYRKAIEQAHWIAGATWAVGAGVIVGVLNAHNGPYVAITAGLVESIKTGIMVVPNLVVFEMTDAATRNSEIPFAKTLPMFAPSLMSVGFTLGTHVVTQSPNPILSSAPVIATALPAYAFLTWKRRRERAQKNETIS